MRPTINFTGLTDRTDRFYTIGDTLGLKAIRLR